MPKWSGPAGAPCGSVGGPWIFWEREQPANTTQLLARPLGPRASRGMVGSADPAAELTPVAAAVLVAIPPWWSARATRAGLTGKWTDVHFAVNQARKRDFQEWAPLEGINPKRCRHLTAFSSRNDPAARKRLKDLAEGRYAYFADEPGRYFAWCAIADTHTRAL